MTDRYDPYEERQAFIRFAGIRKKRILDVGAGKGISSVIAAKEFDNEVTIIDPYADQINNARQNIMEYGLEDKISFIEADITDNTLEDDSFDCVICFNADWNPLINVERPLFLNCCEPDYISIV